jgi:hypothetical protein
MRTDNELHCPGCGGRLTLATAWDGESRWAEDFHPVSAPDWEYELQLLCDGCTRCWPLVRLRERDAVSRIRKELQA